MARRTNYGFEKRQKEVKKKKKKEAKLEKKRLKKEQAAGISPVDDTGAPVTADEDETPVDGASRTATGDLTS